MTKYFLIYYFSGMVLLAAMAILLTPARSRADFQFCVQSYTFDKNLYETFATNPGVSCTKEKGKVRLELQDTFHSFSASTAVMANPNGGQRTVCLMESQTLGIYNFIEIRARDKTQWNKFIASQCAMMMGS